MATGFDRDALLEAFDEIGRAAVAAGTRLQIAVYGGSALMLASNFRFATEDVDIADIGGEAVDQVIAVLGKYFPVSAASAEKQRFLLNNMSREGESDAPEYPR